MGDTLTPKQERFVNEYVIDLNGAAAYRRAGYAAKTNAVATVGASRLLADVKVSARVVELQAARAERTQVCQDWVIRRLVSEAERVGDGASHSARVAALKLLGEHVGLWKPRPPLEEFLMALPPAMAEELRRAIVAGWDNKVGGGG